MTIVKQEYCCVRPMRYLGAWPVVQGGHQHKWRCDRCGEQKIADDFPPGGLARALAPASVSALG